MITIVEATIDPGSLLTQEFKTEKTYNFERIRPWLGFHDVPDTLSLTLSLEHEGAPIASVSQTFLQMKEQAELNSDFKMTSRWFHCWVSFIFDKVLFLQKGLYTISLTRTDAGGGDVTWIKPHEDLLVPMYGDILTNDTMRPYGIQISSYEKVDQEIKQW